MGVHQHRDRDYKVRIATLCLLLEDQWLDVWLGDTACIHNEVNALFIGVKELVSGVIRDVDAFITSEIA